MDRNRIRNDPSGWVDLIFASKAARQGGVVRRNVAWVAAEIGEDRLVREVRRRGFHMIRSGPQYVIFCNRDGIRLIC